MVSKVSKAYREPQTQGWDVTEDNDVDVGTSAGRDEGMVGGMRAVGKMQGCRGKRKMASGLPKRKLFH